MKLFYLVFLILFPFTCGATESQITVLGARYAVDENDHLLFSPHWNQGSFTQEDINSNVEKILKDKDKDTLKFLKAEMKSPSQGGLFCYMYFWPDLTPVWKNREQNLTYHDLYPYALDPQKFPTENSFKELFKEKMKEKVGGRRRICTSRDLFGCLFENLFEHLFEHLF